MLNKSIEQLKEVIKNGSSDQAADASFILRSISQKKPDDVLKKYAGRLPSYIDLNNKYSRLKITELKQKLDDISNLSVIQIIVILHNIGKVQNGSKIIWPKKLKLSQNAGNNPSDISFLREMNDTAPSTRPPHLISKYIEGNRVMPPDSPIPGAVELWRSQSAIEIMDLFSPYSTVRYIDMMSAAQVFKTFIIENVILYGIGANPSPMLYMSGTEALLKKWNKRLEPMLDSAGVRHKFHAQVESKSSRKSGDTDSQKLFTGGFLELASAQSPTSMRSDSVKYLFIDEANAAPPHLTTGEGRFDLVAEARTKAWENRKKIGTFSTPTLYGDGDIVHNRFSLGDQCEQLVPCPHCGKFQILNRGTENGTYGLRPETKAGELQFVWYLCDHCHEAIFEYHKNVMFPRGRWEPMAKPEKFRRSFHINSLYSPWGAYSWLSYWIDYQTALNTPDGMRSFTNLQDGLPYREKGATPDRDKIIALRGKYRQNTVPDYVLFLTLSVDVQRGSKTEGKEGPRLEIEVLGHGSKYRSASVLYKKFYGSIENAYQGSYEKLYQWMVDTGMIFKRKDGRELKPKIIFVDSGDGVYNDVVYEFCGRLNGAYPIKGQGGQGLKQRKKEKGDEMTRDNFMRYRGTVLPGGMTTLYMISTNYYKKQLYNRLFTSIREIESGGTGEEVPGFCDFPMDYDADYFDGLLNAEMRADQSFHKLKDGRPDEPLDLRVYNLCAGDVYLDKEVQKDREYYVEHHGLTKKQAEAAITRSTVIKDMERAMEVEKNANK